MTYADDNNDGNIDASSEIRREQNYYPFGLEHKGYNNMLSGVKNNLKTYQGQEFTEDLGLNTHEWRYRISDPAIGRFWQVDPLAEDYTYNSTYAFQENMLGLGIELEGLEKSDFRNVTDEAQNKVTTALNDLWNNLTYGEAGRQIENGITQDPVVKAKNDFDKNSITKKSGSLLKENIGKATKGAVMTMTEEGKIMTGHAEDAIVISGGVTGGATLPALPYVEGADVTLSVVQLGLFLSEEDYDGALQVFTDLAASKTIDKVTKKIPATVTKGTNTSMEQVKAGADNLLNNIYDAIFNDND